MSTQEQQVAADGGTLPDDDPRPEVKVLLDDVQQLPLTLLRRAIVEDGDGQRMGHTDGIGHLGLEKQHGEDKVDIHLSEMIWVIF